MLFLGVYLDRLCLVKPTRSLQPPVLEEWEELAEGDGMGSFKGNVFGQPGLADGTAMTTAPVDVAGRRIQDQVMAVMNWSIAGDQKLP